VVVEKTLKKTDRLFDNRYISNHPFEINSFLAIIPRLRPKHKPQKISRVIHADGAIEISKH